MKVFSPRGQALLVGTLIMIAFSVPAAEGAKADAFESLQVARLSPKLEQKSALLGRRFGFVLSRHRAHVEMAPGRCQSGHSSACRLEAWQEFLTELSHSNEADQIYRVHRYINRFRYVTDKRNWHRPDYWAIPEQLFERGGDCEDYVIAKYLSLRALGIDAKRLRVVVVYDRKKRVDHAVLAVLGSDETLILDNYHRRVMTWADMKRRYRPYYSLNENAVWIHNAKA